jgi:hypothetical protein
LEKVVEGVEPAKMILRLLALDLGLQGLAREKKRAIQLEHSKGGKSGRVEKGIDVVE